MEKIRKYGDKVLRKKSKPVENINGSTLKITEALKNVLINSGGLGLAAPQIGILKRIFIAKDFDTNKLITVINPEIKEMKRKEIDMEGCMSLPEIFLSIERAKKVVLTGLDEKEKNVSFEISGLLARCFQHEIDHLNGVLIIDYATEEEKKFWQDKLGKIKREMKDSLS